MGDVVILGKGEDGSNLVLTLAAKRRPRAVSLYIEEDEEGGNEVDESNPSEENGAKRPKIETPQKNGVKSSGPGSRQNGNDGGEEDLGRGHRRAILDQKTRVCAANVYPI